MSTSSSNSLLTKAAGKKNKRPAGSGAARIGVELDSACVKAVELRVKSNGDIQVDHFAVTELNYFTYDEVPELLRNFLRDHGFKKRKVVSCFPRNLSTIRFMQLPSDNPHEIQEMVGFQAIKQIPYNREDMIVDHEIISVSENGYSDVLLAIAHKNVIYQHIDAIEGAGCQTSRIDINSQAAFRAYLYFKNRAIAQDSADKSQIKPTYVALINIDYTQTNIQIIGNDQVVFTRGIMHGVMHLLLKEKKFQAESANINWQSELMDELRRSFAVFSREQQGAFIEKIVLAGGVSNFHNIERNMGTRFQVPVEVFNLRDHITGLEQFQDDLTIQGKEISLLAPIGMLLQGTGRQLDMIPEVIKNQRKSKRRMASLTVASLLFLVLLAVGGVNFYAEVNLKAQEIGLLQTKLDSLSPRVRKLEQMRTKINLIRDHVGTSRMSLDFLRELYRVIPESIALSGFLYDETKYIIIKGTADTMSNVFDLIPTIEDSPYFEKVSSRGVNRRKVGSKEVVDFEIQCSLIREDIGEAPASSEATSEQASPQPVPQEKESQSVAQPEASEAESPPAVQRPLGSPRASAPSRNIPPVPPQPSGYDGGPQIEEGAQERARMLQTDSSEMSEEEWILKQEEQYKQAQEDYFDHFKGDQLPPEQQQLLRDRIQEKFLQKMEEAPSDPYSGFKPLPGVPDAVKQRSLPQRGQDE